MIFGLLEFFLESCDIWLCAALLNDNTNVFETFDHFGVINFKLLPIFSILCLLFENMLDKNQRNNKNAPRLVF